MTTITASIARVLALHVDGGRDIGSAVAQALSGHGGAGLAWVLARGQLRRAILEVRGGPTRDVETPTELVTLVGSCRLIGETVELDLGVTLAREGDLGLGVLAGRLVASEAEAVDVQITVLVEASLAASVAREAGERVREPTPQPGPVEPLIPTPMPSKPARPVADLDTPYPEPGDRVVHFAFGECSVEESDGDRIRLKQDRDGRVREVALEMLRISAPEEIEGGKRLFRLDRRQ